MIQQVWYLRSVSEAGNPLPVTHHCGLPAAVKAGVGGSAPAYHAGASVVTIIRASSLRATERPSCTLRPCRRAPTAAGRTLGRSGAVHRANTAFTTSFPVQWRPRHVSNTIGEKSTPIRPHDSALSRHFCSPLSVRKVAALPRSGLPVTGFRWTIVSSTARSRPPVPSILLTEFQPGGLRFRRCPPRGHGELGTG